jgi:hypothetical protein
MASATALRSAFPRTAPAPTRARVFRPGDAGYDAHRSGFNTAVEHRPDLIVDAAGPDDVVAAVRLAAATGRPLAVMTTGHGPSRSADGPPRGPGTLDPGNLFCVNHNIPLEEARPWTA